MKTSDPDAAAAAAAGNKPESEVVNAATVFERVVLHVVGVSSFPKGKGGFIEIYHPNSTAGVAPVFTTQPIPQSTATLKDATAEFSVDQSYRTKTVELRFMRKKKESEDAPRVLGSYTLDLKETPTGLLTVPVTEAAGKVKFSIASFNPRGQKIITAAAAAAEEDDDDLLPRLLPRFTRATDTGTINVSTLAMIAGELDIDCDAEALAAIIPPAQRDAIYLEDCLVFLAQAIKDERGGEGGAQGPGAGPGGPGGSAGDLHGGRKWTAAGSGGTPLSPLDYCIQSCRGTLPEDAHVSLVACFTARNLLFLSSFVIFTAVSSAIITYCSLTWLDAAVARQSQLLEQSMDLLRIFMTSFERVMLRANSVSLQDKTDTIGNWMGVHWRNERLLVTKYAEKELMRMLPFLTILVANRDAEYVGALADRVAGLLRVIPAARSTVPADAIIGVVKRWIDGVPPGTAAGREGAAIRDEQARAEATNGTLPLWRWKTFATLRGGMVESISTATDGADDGAEDQATADDDPAEGANGRSWVPLQDARTQLCPTEAEHAAATPGHVFMFNATLALPGPGDRRTGLYRVIAARFSAAELNLCFVLTPANAQALSLQHAVHKYKELDALSSQVHHADPVREELSIWTRPAALEAALDVDPYAYSPAVADGLVRTFASGFPRKPWCDGVARRCAELAEFAAATERDAYSEWPQSAIIEGDDGYDSIVSAVYVPQIRGVLVITRKLFEQAAYFKERQTSAFNFLNYEFVLTTELVLTGNDPVTGAIVPQSTSFRFDFGCHNGICERFHYAAETAFLAFSHNSSGFLTKPDYRPEPVVSAYARLEDGIDRGVVVERDVQDLRGVTIRNIVAIVDEINREAFDTYEMQILRYEGIQASKAFDTADETGCDAIYCIVRDGVVIWREDCQHCVMAPTLTGNSTYTYLTEFRFADECALSLQRPCTDAALQSANSELARFILENPPGDDETRSVTFIDYRGVEVVASYVFLSNLSTSVVYKVDKETLEGPIVFSIIVTAIVASACTLVGLAGVLLATTRVITAIDRDAEQYKLQVNAEKEKFASNISHLVPTHVAGRLKNNLQQSVVVEQSPSGVVVNMDIVSFSELVRGWNSGKFLAFTSYYFAVMSSLGKRYNLFCSKAYGDAFVALGAFGRLEDENREEAVLGAANFAVIAVQLMSAEFAHNDVLDWAHMRAAAGGKRRRATRRQQEKERQRSKAGAQAAGAGGGGGAAEDAGAESGGGEQDGHVATAVGTPAANATLNERGDEILKMPNLRIGCHTGPFAAGFMQIGSTPRYDAFGPTMQVAARMQATAAAGRIHCSEEFKELLDVADKNFDYEFDVQRRTILKGRLTHPSYVMRSAHVPVPEDFLAAFGISRAHRNLDPTADARDHKRRSDQGSDASSMASSRMSKMSGGTSASKQSRSSFR